MDTQALITIPKCSICDDKYTDTVIKTNCCGKTFHKECLTIWVEKEPSCPNCKAKANATARPSSPTSGLSAMFERTDLADKMEIVPDDLIEPRRGNKEEDLEAIKEQMRKQAEDHARELKKLEMMLAKALAKTAEDRVSHERKSLRSSSESVSSIDSTTSFASAVSTSSTASTISTKHNQISFEEFMDDGVTPRCQYLTTRKTQCARNVPKDWWEDKEHPYCTFHINYDAKKDVVEEAVEKRKYTIRQQQIDKSIEAANNLLKRQSAAVERTNEISTEIYELVEETRNAGKDSFNKLKERYSKTVSKRSKPNPSQQ